MFFDWLGTPTGDGIQKILKLTTVFYTSEAMIHDAHFWLRQGAALILTQFLGCRWAC